MVSIINWSIGTPLTTGKYLVVLNNGSVDTDDYEGYFPTWKKYLRREIVAWIKINEIKTDIKK